MVEKDRKRNQERSHGHIRESLKPLLQRFEESPTSDLSIEIALLYDELGDLETARYYFERALELDPNNPCAYYGLAMLFEAEGEVEKAIAYYKEAIALDPHYIAAHFFLACLYDDIGEVYLAIYHYEQVLSLDPDHFYAHLNLGSVYEGLNQDERALYHFQEAEMINPHHHLLHFNYGVVYRKMGEYEKAKESYHRSLHYSKDYPFTFLNLGLLYKDHDHDLDQALAIYSEGIQHHPTVAVLYYNRGCIYALKGEKQRAISDLKQALRYDPSLLEYLLEDPELAEVKHFFEKKEK